MGQIQTTPETKTRHGRRRRQRRHARVGKAVGKRVSRDVGRELRAWLKVADAVLVGIERTAWSLRNVADEVSEAFQGTVTEFGTLRDDAKGGGLGLMRLTQTGFMLAQVAASYRLYSLRAAFLPEQRAEALLESLHATNAKRFYRASTKHGGAFLKIGQLLSARPDILPKPWVAELAGLQDAAPALSFESVKQVIERELAGSLEELFASFEQTPLAAASIGQVHRALTHDGQQVAVKVQRPGIAELVRMDMQSLELFLQSMRSSLPDIDYDTIVSEVRGSVMMELDYAEEAVMTLNVARPFVREDGIVFPVPRASLCTNKVLTTSFIEGRKITTVLDELDARAETGDLGARKQLSDLLGQLLSAYLKQILLNGAFQADPHPGNLLVTTDGKLAILDFGCSKTLLPEVREAYVALVRAFLMSDHARMGQLFTQLGFRTKSGKHDTLHVFADAILAEFQKAMTSGTFSWPDREAIVAQAGTLLVALENDPVVSIPTEFVMIARVFGTLMGLFTHYEPDIAFAEHVMPVLTAALFAMPEEAPN
ncbi:MAG TPA: AarF/ABC1/UbiB kinase family protein [Polyangiales bacterium]